jgi:hypothetical protein
MEMGEKREKVCNVVDSYTNDFLLLLLLLQSTTSQSFRAGEINLCELATF